jgi:hypothetical protein
LWLLNRKSVWNRKGTEFSWNTLMFSSFTVPFFRQKQAFGYSKRSVKYSNLQYHLRGRTFISFEPFAAAWMKDAVWHKRQDKWRHPSDWQTGLWCLSWQRHFLLCVHNRLWLAATNRKGVVGFVLEGLGGRSLLLYCILPSDVLFIRAFCFPPPPYTSNNGVNFSQPKKCEAPKLNPSSLGGVTDQHKVSRVFPQSMQMLKEHFWISFCQLLPNE